MTSRHPAPPRIGTKNKFVFLRSMLLVIWIAAVNSWLRHHLGFGWDDSGTISAVVAASGTVLFVLDKAGDKRPEAWWANLFRWLDLRLLGLLYVVVAIPMLLFSSVAITNSSSDTIIATLARAEPPAANNPFSGRAQQLTGQQVLFKWVPTSPFGEAYTLTVDGYLPQIITVFPLTGAMVTPQRDLLPSLSVLFRPDADCLRTLADGGSLRVWTETQGHQVLIATSTPGAAKSIMVGIGETIPSTSIENWRLELTAENLTPGMIARRILQWEIPDHAKTKLPLQPGMVLRAELQTHSGIVMAGVRLTLGTDRLTDVMLDSTQQNQNKSK